MTPLNRMNKTDLINRVGQAEKELKVLREQLKALVVILIVVTCIALLF